MTKIIEVAVQQYMPVMRDHQAVAGAVMELHHASRKGPPPRPWTPPKPTPEYKKGWDHIFKKKAKKNAGRN